MRGLIPRRVPLTWSHLCHSNPARPTPGPTLPPQPAILWAGWVGRWGGVGLQGRSTFVPFDLDIQHLAERWRCSSSCTARSSLSSCRTSAAASSLSSPRPAHARARSPRAPHHIGGPHGLLRQRAALSASSCAAALSPKSPPGLLGAPRGPRRRRRAKQPRARRSCSAGAPATTAGPDLAGRGGSRGEERPGPVALVRDGVGLVEPGPKGEGRQPGQGG